MRYRLNKQLLLLLPELCRGGIMQSFESSGINYLTWSRRLSTDRIDHPFKGPAVEQVIQFCNAHRISVRLLFSPSDQPDIIPTMAELFTHDRVFHPSSFDWDAFGRAFGIRSKTHLSTGEMMKRMGMSRRPHQSWFTDPDTLRIPALLLFCDTFDHDLYEFIIDRNVAKTDTTQPVQPIHQAASALSDEETAAALQEEFEQMKKKNLALNKLLANVRAENRKLKDERVRMTGQMMELQRELELLRNQVEALKGHTLINMEGLVAENREEMYKGHKGSDVDLA